MDGYYLMVIEFQFFKMKKVMECMVVMVEQH